MSVDKEITEDTGSGYGATAVGERPARGARGLGAFEARTHRAFEARKDRAAPRRAPAGSRRGAATRPAAGGGLAEGARRASVPRNAPRAPFVLLVVGLLCGGLVSLLLLNLVLAQDSFRANDLRKSTELLHQQAEDKKTEVMLNSQSQVLSDRAKVEGMKEDPTNPEFLEVPEGQGKGASAGQENTVGAEAQASQAEVARP